MTAYTAVEVCSTYEGTPYLMDQPVKKSERRFEFESESETWELRNEAELLCSAGTHRVCGEETVHIEIVAILKGGDVVEGWL